MASKFSVPTLRFPEFQEKWNKTKLGSITDKVGEKNTGNTDNEIFEVCSISNQYGFVSQSEQFKTRRLDGLDKTQYQIVSRGDFAYNPARINVGSIALLEKWENALVSSLYVCFRLKKGYNEQFFKHYIKTNKFQKSVLRNTEGSVREYLFYDNLCRIISYFPSCPEQQKISSFFSLLDQRIEKQQEKISCLEEYKIGLMQKIFSQEIRFQNENGEDYPNWETKRIGDVFDERTERGRPDLDLLSVTISEGVVRRTNIDGKDNSSEDKSNYKVVEIGDIVYNSMRMWQGASGVSSYKGITSPAYTVLKSNTAVCPGFFGYLFKTKSMIGQFQRHSQGLTSDTWNLKYPQLSTIKVHVPCLSEQRKIDQFLSGIDELIKLNLELLEQWKLLKKGLLQQMFV